MKYKLKYKEYTLREPAAQATDTPEKAFSVVRDDFNPLQEEMYLLCLNVKNQVLEKHMIAKGGMNSHSITPAEIFRLVLLSGASHFILCHNHPSGDTSPSEDDIVFTRKVAKASKVMGLSFLDHLVFSGEGYYSMKKRGLL